MSNAKTTTTTMNCLPHQPPTHPVIVSNPYARAQELNESAAAFASEGKYDRAISELTRALEVWKRCRSEDEAVYVCMCPRCNSHAHFCPMQIDDKDMDDSTSSSSTTPSKKRQSQEEQLFRQDYNSDSCGTQDNNTICFDHGYMHQDMLRIPCREHFDFQNVSSGVALIVIFNLAIVHHMSAVFQNCKHRMAKTLRLYQLVNECLNKFVVDTQSCRCSRTVSFDMGTMIQLVLVNNLGHLHSCLENPLMRTHCSEQLLPILMCVIDDRQLRNTNAICGQTDLEGFVRTICPLVLTSQCADAA